MKYILKWRDSKRGELEIVGDKSAITTAHEALLKDEYASGFELYVRRPASRSRVFIVPEMEKQSFTMQQLLDGEL